MHSTDPVFDDVYVISDLHMGGETGFQIFDAGELLGQTIDHLTEKSPSRNVALVINGDMVDFLAEPEAVYFDSAGAISKLNRIVGDDAFRGVWEALQRFVKAKNRTLFVNLGNHDFELALPWVRERLVDILTDSTPDRRGDVRLAFDGAGVRLRVGPATILCLHGNEVDTWNICDFEELRQQGRDKNFGVPRDAWTPNAGTKLVIDVMNDVKKRFPFVDLLKPEDKAVVPTLFALDPSVKSKLPGVLSVVARLTKDTFFRWAGFLSGDEQTQASAAHSADTNLTLDELLADAFSQGTTQRDDAQTLLLETERRFRNHVNPLHLGADTGSEQLGFTDAVGAWFVGKPKHELLREALQGLENDMSFGLKHHDSTFKQIDEVVGSQIDYLVTGHTHMYRALDRSAGGFYYNSGTWVRLIQLTADVLQSEQRFKGYYDAIKAGTLAALDKEPGMVMRRPCVVAIREKSGSVRGTLRQVTSTPDGVTLEEIPNTRFVKG